MPTLVLPEVPFSGATWVPEVNHNEEVKAPEVETPEVETPVVETPVEPKVTKRKAKEPKIDTETTSNEEGSK